VNNYRSNYERQIYPHCFSCVAQCIIAVKTDIDHFTKKDNSTDFSYSGYDDFYEGVYPENIIHDEYNKYVLKTSDYRQYFNKLKKIGKLIKIINHDSKMGQYRWHKFGDTYGYIYLRIDYVFYINLKPLDKNGLTNLYIPCVLQLYIKSYPKYQQIKDYKHYEWGAWGYKHCTFVDDRPKRIEKKKVLDKIDSIDPTIKPYKRGKAVNRKQYYD
jgi:hypothetical protein